MTRVDFYILQQAQGAAQFACRLCEKIHGLGQRVYLHASDAQQAQQLDDLLWTWRDQSFLPHTLTGDATQEATPILIGYRDAPSEQVDIMINLSHEVPGFFSRFERVAELVDTDEQSKQAARQRFRFYKERGYPLESHNI